MALSELHRYDPSVQRLWRSLQRIAGGVVRYSTSRFAMLQEVRFALRMLMKSPGFTALALLTLRSESALILTIIGAERCCRMVGFEANQRNRDPDGVKHEPSHSGAFVGGAFLRSRPAL